MTNEAQIPTPRTLSDIRNAVGDSYHMLGGKDAAIADVIHLLDELTTAREELALANTETERLRRRISVMMNYVCDDKEMYKDPEWAASEQQFLSGADT